jgi:hypothetical protein
MKREYEDERWIEQAQGRALVVDFGVEVSVSFIESYWSSSSYVHSG